jgi:hypothetical protein
LRDDWLRDDWFFDELTNDISCLSETCLSSDLLSDLSEDDERISRSKRSISLIESRVDFRKNWSEMTDENSLNEDKL